MRCEDCGRDMVFEQGWGWVCVACGDWRRRRYSDSDVFVVSSMAAVVDWSERYFKKVVLTSSYFAMQIDEDGNWATHTDSLRAGREMKDADTRAHHQAKDSIRYLRNQTDVS